MKSSPWDIGKCPFWLFLHISLLQHRHLKVLMEECRRGRVREVRDISGRNGVKEDRGVNVGGNDESSWWTVAYCVFLDPSLCPGWALLGAWPLGQRGAERHRSSGAPWLLHQVSHCISYNSFNLSGGRCQLGCGAVGWRRLERGEVFQRALHPPPSPLPSPPVEAGRSGFE